MAGYRETNTPLTKLEPVNSMYHGLRYSDEETTMFWNAYKDSYQIQTFPSQQELIDAVVSLLE